jgi:hypothetical protein
MFIMDNYKDDNLLMACMELASEYILGFVITTIARIYY